MDLKKYTDQLAQEQVKLGELKKKYDLCLLIFCREIMSNLSICTQTIDIRRGCQITTAYTWSNEGIAMNRIRLGHGIECHRYPCLYIRH